MPDYGLTKAISKAVRKGASSARVLRPGEAEALAADAAKKAAKNAPPVNVAPTPVIQPEELTAAPKIDPAAPAAPADPVTPTPTPAPEVLPTPGKTAQAEADVNLARGQQTAEGITKSKLGDFDIEESHMPNFDKLEGPDDVKAAIAFLAEKNKERITAARQGVITDAEMAARGEARTAQLARDLGMSTKRVREAISPEETWATQQVVNAGAKRLKDLADKWMTGNATDLEKLQFARTQQTLSAAIDQLMGARADWGRSGRVLRNPGTLSAEALANMRETFEAVGGARDMEKLAKAISLTEDVGGVTKLATKYGRSKVLGVTTEVFISNILSGFKTLIVNGMGTSIQLMNVVETAVAAQARRVVKGAGKAALRFGQAGQTAADRLAVNIGRYLTAEEGVAIGEASALMHGTLGATRDAWRLAARAFRTGQTLDDVVKFETGAPGRVKQISAENLLRPEWQDTYFAKFLNGLGAAVRVVPERGMAPTDEFFKTMAYRAEIERQAFLHVSKQLDAGKITLQDAEQAAREFMENAPPKVVAAAEQFMKEMTFQNNLGASGRHVQAWVNSTPGMTMIAPFIRTPVNLFKQAHAKRSPLALFSAQFWRDVRKGGRARDLALTRVAMGSATVAVVANYVADGTITGGGPQNPQERKVWLETHQPYSIRVVNPFTGVAKYHSYARIEPIAFVIGATADACEIYAYLNSNTESLKDLKDEEAQGYEVAAAIVAGVANNTMSKTFMSGMANTMEMFSDPRRYIEPWLAGYATAFVPWSGAVNTAAQISDPYLREAWTMTDKIKSRIPGLSATLPASRDFFGESKERARGELLGVVSPMPSMTPEYDPVMNELARVMQSSRTVPITMPSKQVDGMRLDAREYDKLITLARVEPIFDGMTFKEKLDEVMGMDTYLDATDTMKSEILRDIQNRADSAARAMLEQEDDAFAERIALYRTKKARIRFGEDIE